MQKGDCHVSRASTQAKFHKNIAHAASLTYVSAMKKNHRLSLGDRRRQVAILLLVIATALGCFGCLSSQHRIARYLNANQDRPEAVRMALRDGDRLVTGMTPQEVRLVMGPPARTESGMPPERTIWHFDQPKRREIAQQQSAMWALPVPHLSVFFGADDTVIRIIDFDSRQPTATNPAGEDSRPATARRPTQPQPRLPEVTEAVPTYRPRLEEVNVHGWPAITLQGVSVGGHTRNAVINGSVHESGERIGPVLLDTIYANGVVLEYRGQRTFLRPGESTANGR